MSERDKFLTEAMGECWHYSVYTVRGNECVCGKWWSECVKTQPDFSTWEGFGKLWEWAQKQDWFDSFATASTALGYDTIARYMVNPDRFADAVYEYLKERKP